MRLGLYPQRDVLADPGFIKCDIYIDTACVHPGGFILACGGESKSSTQSLECAPDIFGTGNSKTGIIDYNDRLERRERRPGPNCFPVDRCR